MITQERQLDKIARLLGIEDAVDYYNPANDILFKELLARGIVDHSDIYKPMPDVFSKIFAQLEPI